MGSPITWTPPVRKKLYSISPLSRLTRKPLNPGLFCFHRYEFLSDNTEFSNIGLFQIKLIKMAKYLKLGIRAQTFHDSATGVNINNKQVIRIKNDKDLEYPSLQKALREGHIVISTFEEWEAYRTLYAKQVKDGLKNIKVKTVTTTTTGSTAGVNTGTDEDEDEDVDFKADGESEDEELSKSEMIDAIKEHGNLSKAEKKDLVNKTEEELKELWKSVKPTE